jgi:hypothetical protein
MIPTTELEAWRSLAQTTCALAGLFHWLASGSEREQDDADMVECYEEQMGKLSNATHIDVVEKVTGHNMRDQLSVDETVRLYEAVELARMRGSRN